VTTLRLELEAHQNFDLALDAPRFVLWRHRGVVWLSLDDDAAVKVRRQLAFNGVRATPQPTGMRPTPPRLVRAVGTGLAPARLDGDDLDIIEVTVASLRDATTQVLRRPFRRWPLGTRRRTRCRALLRDSDLVLELRRTAWCSRATLRAARGSLRPALFDVGAASPSIRVYATEGRLTCWIEG
jgi:hypothetical protein